MHVDSQAIVRTGKKVQMRLSHLRARILARKHSLTRVASGDIISGRTAIIFELEALQGTYFSFLKKKNQVRYHLRAKSAGRKMPFFEKISFH